MNPNNFRVGNLISYKGETYTLIGITEQYPILNTDAFGHGVVEWKDIEGIKLNHINIELVCGFTFKHAMLRSGIWDFDKTGFAIQYDPCRGDFWYPKEESHPPIEFIHELQNLYFSIERKELIVKQS